MNKYNLPRSTPGEQGVCAKGIIDFINAIEKDAMEKEAQELHSFMIVRHGYVIAEGWWEPYKSEMPHMLFSLSKSFTSTAIGMAVEEGILNVEDNVCSFFKEELPSSISDNLNAMKIKHLLSMSSGHASDTMAGMFSDPDGNWERGFLGQPINYKPGTNFVYNTGATYMLSAILQRKTGKTLMEYLKPRLFEPLGIMKPDWESCPMGINTGGYGLKVTTEDIAKFGQLYLQKGIWEGQRLISEEWIVEATKKQIDNSKTGGGDWSQGYGYQFWRCRNSVYRGDGAFGQYCIVMPDQDVVIAITGAVGDMQLPLDYVFEHLLPAFANEKLGKQVEEEAELKNRIQKLEFFVGKVLQTSEKLKEYSGYKYKLEDNILNLSEIQFNIEDQDYVLRLLSFDHEYILKVKSDKWTEIDNNFYEYISKVNNVMSFDMKVFTRGAIVDDGCVELIVRLVETPFNQRIILNFKEDKIKIEIKNNLGFEKQVPIVLHGSI